MRGETFVTRKVTRAAARIKLGLEKRLYLGNLDAKRDWGHAKDFVRAMWLILQHDKPGDFVIATGEQHSVREMCTLAFDKAGIKLVWEGDGANEVGRAICGLSNRRMCEDNIIVAVDKRYFRPTEVDSLIGDYSKAKNDLGWEPQISFYDMINEMFEYDLKEAERDSMAIQNGYTISNNPN